MSGLRELLNAATPGPWKIGYADGSGERDITTPTSREDYSTKNVVNGGEDDWGIPHGVLRPEDAALIALAPEMAELLLDMADALRAIGYAPESAAENIEALLARLDKLTAQ